ncbi:MAG: 2OG-Fe(II) oxygenase [Deltaproteobacteria bacterium]|nr:2OG-Fe(II) oxygenase [Deltaproteobacteria bacterium]
MEVEGIAVVMGATGLCVCPGFLAAATVASLATDLEDIQRADGFARAGTGRGGGHEVRDRVRKDDVHWLDRAAPTAAQALLWIELDHLKQAFNRTLYLGLVELVGHYAAYPAGGFYQRHRDRFAIDAHDDASPAHAADDARIVSVILYLNRDWHTGDGGELRVYDADDAPAAGVGFVDVDPIGGTLVCFLSAEREHEVLISHCARQSFAGWFRC